MKDLDDELTISFDNTSAEFSLSTRIILGSSLVGDRRYGSFVGREAVITINGAWYKHANLLFYGIRIAETEEYTVMLNRMVIAPAISKSHAGRLCDEALAYYEEAWQRDRDVSW